MLTEMLIGATVYIVTGYTDMRKGIDGLAQIVEGSERKSAAERKYSKIFLLMKSSIKSMTRPATNAAAR